MPWPDALQDLAREDLLIQALLKRVLPRATPAHGRVSAALAARLLSGPPPCEATTLHLLVPPGDYSALSAATGLLVADVFHKNRGGSRLSGHVLLITPGIGNAADRLDALQVADGMPLTKLWPHESFSRYQPFTSEHPHVLLANPGWVARLPDLPRRIGAAVIDATHPQTEARLPELLRATEKVPLRLLVTPLHGYHHTQSLPATATWPWYPGALAAAASALGLNAPPSASLYSTAYVTHDADLDATLERVRKGLRQLMGLMRPVPQSLLEAWRIYHRLRLMITPLHEYERAARRRWGGMMLRDQLDALEDADLSDAALQGPWRRLVQDLKGVYALLEVRAQSAKYTALEQRLQALLTAPCLAVPLQVVCPTEAETEGLRETMTVRNPALLDAVLSGTLEFLHGSALARRSHFTSLGRVIWPGYPHGRGGMLGLYPAHEHDYLLYPHELPLLNAQLRAHYDAAESAQHCEPLRAALHALNVPTPNGVMATPTPRPALRVLDLQGAPLKLLIEAPIDVTLDLDDLATTAQTALEALHARTPGADGRNTSSSPLTPHLTVHFDDGAINVPVSSHMDVFYPATRKLLRIPATDVTCGMQVIVMVDDAYSTIFDRLIEVLDGKLPPTQRLLLQLWAAAKNRLNAENPNVRALWRNLNAAGLTEDYSTLRSWLAEFGSDPQQFSAMQLLAVRSGVYPKEDLIEQTFTVICSMRGRNRTAGRALHRVLRAIATGENYREAMNGARKIDRNLAELLDAAELRIVTHVTRVTA
ncbi:hypothetical protein K7W42_12855 [Deinococcus sp. HMF7604]|uniref:hypothetical protein n=1 Tax=Deinococcus betulae TaxID=2873312 RepID=UPI001CCC86EF|nr:hypothetical protein [Deinococcus betulae]MBZ9751747.1 hypothetical protein [Deinococcus betulae]